ncbi:ankyrin repeat domain-containing protein [Arenicella xantha]|uniref:Ankyrin repeat protein n=1 Tax=Arenicella xantha TaxID=644221 RepID=A0A395JJF6_9GAMM|nr:ankyrin repeat domain-containing protein [Arenicella xantha]RBP48814.1 ankyrin repeat protein [Arenicella xantha]
MNSKSDIELFDVAIEPWIPGAIQKIKKYCTEGANPNLVCMNASTTRGPVTKGLTLLTHSVHEGAFRVDLVGHQIRNKQLSMLTYLFENGMPYDVSKLSSAVRQQYIPAVELLLAQGIDPDRPDDDETMLMLAASLGNMDIVKMLVKAGADVHRYAFDNIEWTASFVANKAKHKDVAKWLKSQMSKEFFAKQKEVVASRNPKFRNLYKNATSAEDLSTDDIVNKLEQWDKRFGIKVKKSDGCSLSILFEALPENIEEFWDEVIDLCPDIDDNNKAVLHQLETKKSIGLWWD